MLRILFAVGRPKLERPGLDVSGEVEAVGRSVTRFRTGDAVFGACKGALAEFACASESRLAGKPDNVTFEQAASVAVAGVTALQGLRDKGRIQPGHKVLINGGSGGVGTFAVQIARSFGAEVTGVCSTRNLELVRSLGADRVIDYTREDFTRGEKRYDLILDNVGNHSAAAYRACLTANGICVFVGGPKGFRPLARFLITSVLEGFVLSRVVAQSFLMFIARVNQEDLATLGELMKARKVVPVVDRRYKLSEAREAMGYAEEGHAQGKVVLTI
jgi:NADPH:quinone reductase-like Zn-dependent oxidoreductase